MQTSVKGMLEVAEGFYRELFTDGTPSVTANGKFLEGMEGGLEDEERRALEGPLTLQKVSSAVASLKKARLQDVMAFQQPSMRWFFRW